MSETKSRWRSRGFWGGLLSSVLAVGGIAYDVLGSGKGDLDWQDGLNLAIAIAGAVAADGRMKATKQLR